MKKVGLLGAGQLASLMAQSLRKKHVIICVYANNLEEPACNFADYVMLGENNIQNLEKFFQFCDLVILESEFFDYQLLKTIEEKTSTKIYPELSCYKKLSTKKAQKDFFKLCEIPFAKTFEIFSKDDLENLSFPLMLKKSFGSYDGYGNLLVHNKEELLTSIETFSQNFTQLILAEEFLEIEQEFACMLVKSHNQSLLLPVVKTHQENNICHIVSYPLQINETHQNEIELIMQKIDENLKGSGVFAFEFFLTKNGHIYINEAAPRVHNSYHFSIEGLNLSQFDLMTLIALGDEIPEIEIKYPFISMVNLLGQTQGEGYRLILPEDISTEQMKIHFYGKKESRKGRKMGHLTLYGDSNNLELAKKIASEYQL